MKNPWVKKNPVLSMWLSNANKAVGSARGQSAGSMKREARKASTGTVVAGTKQVLDFWGGAIAATGRPTVRKRK